MPMSIPGSSSRQKSPPPPLPPPRFIDGLGDGGPDPGWQAVNRQTDNGPASAPVKSGSSLLGGHLRSAPKSYTGYQKNIDFGAEEPSTEGADNAQSEQKIPDLAALLEYK